MRIPLLNILLAILGGGWLYTFFKYFVIEKWQPSYDVFNFIGIIVYVLAAVLYVVLGVIILTYGLQGDFPDVEITFKKRLTKF